MSSGSDINPEPGDVIFGNRLSAVQRLNTLSGDSLTHTGIVVSGAGGLRVVELGARGCFSRPLGKFVSAYRVTAVGHTAVSAPCRARIVERAQQLDETKAIRYSWGNVGLAGSMALARRMVPEGLQPRWIPLSLRIAERIVARIERDSTTCSGLVVFCLEAACDNCRPYVSWPMRPRDRPWRGCTTPTDAVRSDRAGAATGRLARALVTPSDLWVAPCFPERVVSSASGPVVIVDASGRDSTRGPCLASQVDLVESEKGGAVLNPNPNP